MTIRTGGRVIAIAILAFASAADAALAADDAGVHAFLANLFGEAGGRAVVTEPAAPVVRVPLRRRVAVDRALTIRRERPSVTVAAVGPTKPVKVSIYQDRTLRPGDAVMTTDGVRVFAGSRSWPYAKSDFVSLSQAHDLSRDTVKVLAALNTLPPT